MKITRSQIHQIVREETHKINEKLDWSQDKSALAQHLANDFRRAGIKILKHEVMKRGYKGRYGAFIHVKDKDGKKIVMPFSVKDDLMLHYDLGPKSMKLGKVDDTSRVAGGLRKLAQLSGFGQGKLVKSGKYEAVSVDVDKLLQNPKIKKLMQRLDIKKTQSRDAALKILNYFAVNPHALVAFKKLIFGESINEGFNSSQIKKAIDIAKKMSGNMTNATKKIEKIKKGLSENPKVKDALRTANESINEGTDIKVNNARELKRELMKAFNQIWKGKVSDEIYRGDTGEFVVTVKRGSRGELVEFDPEGIARAAKFIGKETP